MKLWKTMTVAGLMGFATLASAQETPQRSITNIAGDVYLYEDSVNEWNTPHGSIFVVTDEGIIVSDPFGEDSVEWLKAELEERFDVPVTHMIYSHAHEGHNRGGEAWGDGVEVISHERTKSHIQAGMTETAIPTITFSDKLTLQVGGKTIEATHLGDVGHSDDLIAVVIRPENVALVVDLVTPKRLPLTDFPDADIQGMVEQLKMVEALDFDILAPGHGAAGTKADVAEQRVYIEELMAAVTAELKAGKSVDEVAASVKMDGYKDWVMYDFWIEQNVRGMARWLQENGKI